MHYPWLQRVNVMKLHIKLDHILILVKLAKYCNMERIANCYINTSDFKVKTLILSKTGHWITHKYCSKVHLEFILLNLIKISTL